VRKVSTRYFPNVQYVQVDDAAEAAYAPTLHTKQKSADECLTAKEAPSAKYFPAAQPTHVSTVDAPLAVE
jgi:hypothetical protein